MIDMKNNYWKNNFAWKPLAEYQARAPLSLIIGKEKCCRFLLLQLSYTFPSLFKLLPND